MHTTPVKLFPVRHNLPLTQWFLGNNYLIKQAIMLQTWQIIISACLRSQVLSKLIVLQNKVLLNHLLEIKIYNRLLEAFKISSLNSLCKMYPSSISKHQQSPPRIRRATPLHPQPPLEHPPHHHHLFLSPPNNSIKAITTINSSIIIIIKGVTRIITDIKATATTTVVNINHMLLEVESSKVVATLTLITTWGLAIIKIV